MLDKKKIIIIAIVGVVVAVLIGAIVWLALSGSRNTTTSTPDAAPTGSAEPVIAEIPAEIEEMATTAAATAVQFQGADTKSQRERNYIAAGFSQEVAANFEPVWFDVFSDPIVGKVSIEATGESLVSAAVSVKSVPSVELESVTGEPGARSYRIAVDVAFQPQWTTDTGSPRFESQYTATWTVTVNEATNTVTGVVQPSADEIPFRPESR